MRTERAPVILAPKYNDPLVHRSWDDFGEEYPDDVPAVRVPLCYEYFVGEGEYIRQFWGTTVTCMRCLTINLRTAWVGPPPRR